MEVEATEMAGDVDDFADEEEPGDFARFHGFAGEFVGVDATGSDFGFLVAFGARGMNLPGVEFLFEGFEGSVGERFWLVTLEPAIREAVGEECTESFFGSGGVACAGFADGLCNVAVGREINFDGLAFAPVTRRLENGGAAEAAMGEEHFFAEGIFIGGGDDFGGDAGEIGVTLAVGGVEEERNESGARGNDLQAELSGEVVAEASGAHFGDGEAASGDDEGGGAVFGGIGADDEGGSAADFADVGVDGDFHTGRAALGFEHGDDLHRGVVAEKLAERFFVIKDFVFFDEGNEVGGRVAGQGGFGEVGILREEVFRLAMEIGEVAAASAGDEDFLADFFGAFEEEDAAAAFCGFGGAEEAGGAGAEYEKVVRSQKVTAKRKRRSKDRPLHKQGASVYTACTNTLLQGACEERHKDGTMFIARMVAVL